MALLWLQGFDQYGNYQTPTQHSFTEMQDLVQVVDFDEINGGGAYGDGYMGITNSDARISGSSFYLNPQRTEVIIELGNERSTYGLRKAFSPSGNKFVYGFGYKYEGTFDDPIPLCGMGVETLGNYVEDLIVWVTTSGALHICSGEGGQPERNNGIENTRGNTTGGLLNFSEWNYIEIEYDATGTDPIYSIYLNNVLALSVENANFAGSPTDMVLYCPMSDVYGQVQSESFMRIDDIYVVDASGSFCNDRLGPQRVAVYAVDGAGANADWTPSAGSNFQCVDDASHTPFAGDTDYVASSTSGDIDTYTLTDLGVDVNSINGVQVTMLARTESGS
jgi:hypothetical protein